MARPAYCTGCGHTMPKMHLLFIHRGQHRCGGRFLPPEEYALVYTTHNRFNIWAGNPTKMNWHYYNEYRIDRDRMRHDRRQTPTETPPVRLNLPSAPRLTNAEAAAERKRVNRIRIGCWKKRSAIPAV